MLFCASVGYRSADLPETYAGNYAEDVERLKREPLVTGEGTHWRVQKELLDRIVPAATLQDALPDI